MKTIGYCIRSVAADLCKACVAGAANFVNQFIKLLRIQTKRHQPSDSQLISCRRIPHNGQITASHQHSAKQNQRGSRNLLAQPAADFDCITYRESAWKPSNRIHIYCLRRSTDYGEVQFSHALPVCVLSICNWKLLRGLVRAISQVALCFNFLPAARVPVGHVLHPQRWHYLQYDTHTFTAKHLQISFICYCINELHSTHVAFTESSTPCSHLAFKV